MSALTAEQVAAVLAEHEGYVLNGSDADLGSGVTGTDTWSCGIRLPFKVVLEDAERAHLAAAIVAAQPSGPTTGDTVTRAHLRTGRMDRSVCAACGGAYIECARCETYVCECADDCLGGGA